mmetsp:Transcript_24398/g.76515  ORF Transcript_24398/g.76515 Transcript_24398/m.76515 type:complete len:217 (+) Transcript_24398:1205-1855(+)
MSRASMSSVASHVPSAAAGEGAGCAARRISWASYADNRSAKEVPLRPRAPSGAPAPAACEAGHATCRSATGASCCSGSHSASMPTKPAALQLASHGSSRARSSASSTYQIFVTCAAARLSSRRSLSPPARLELLRGRFRSRGGSARCPVSAPSLPIAESEPWSSLPSSATVWAARSVALLWGLRLDLSAPLLASPSKQQSCAYTSSSRDSVSRALP